MSVPLQPIGDTITEDVKARDDVEGMTSTLAAVEDPTAKEA